MGPQCIWLDVESNWSRFILGLMSADVCKSGFYVDHGWILEWIHAVSLTNMLRIHAIGQQHAHVFERLSLDFLLILHRRDRRFLMSYPIL